MKPAITALLLFLVAALATSVGASVALAQVIVIDPGHGGGDPGGTGLGLEEKNIVLDTSERFRDLLQADTEDITGGGSWTTHLTRDTDQFIDLAARSAYANSLDADRFLSVHANAFGNTSANGTETFSFSATGTGADLRNLVQEEMVNAWQLTDRGNKTGNFSVLRNTAMPAELHELGFVTNATDAEQLGDADARQLAALAHLHALQRHYGLAAHTPDTGGPPILPALPRPPSTIDITVADKLGPVANAIIFLNGIERGQSNDVGFFRIDELPAEDFLISAQTSEHLGVEKAIQLRVGEVASVQLRLTAAPDTDEPVAILPEDEEPLANSVSGACSHSGSSSWTLAFLVLLLLRSRKTSRRS
jgi:N-acetylmuramoyl-L-alanine amidase